MKIVHILFSFLLGGAEILTVDLINEMCGENEVSLIIVNDVVNEALINTINKKIKVYYLKRKAGSKNPFPIFKLNLLLFRLKPDIVHCHNANMADAVKIKKLNLVYTVHEVGVPAVYFGKYKFLAAISDAVKNDVEERSPYITKTILNGINTRLFTRRTDYTFNPDSTFKLIQLSRLIHKTKGQDILIKAIKFLNDNYNLNNVQFDIVGSGNSYDYLADLTQTLKLSNKVNFLGEKSRDWIYNNICNYNLLVQPSRFEGFGLTVVEGLAAMLPVLASDIAGPKEILSQTSAGFLFKTEDPEDCARQIFSVYQLYVSGNIQSLLSNAENLAETKYSVKMCAQSYLSVYRTLTKGKA